MLKFFRNALYYASVAAQTYTFASKTDKPTDLPDPVLGVAGNLAVNAFLNCFEYFDFVKGREHLAGTAIGSLLCTLWLKLIAENSLQPNLKMQQGSVLITQTCLVMGFCIDLVRMGCCTRRRQQQVTVTAPPQSETETFRHHRLG